MAEQTLTWQEAPGTLDDWWLIDGAGCIVSRVFSPIGGGPPYRVISTGLDYATREQAKEAAFAYVKASAARALFATPPTPEQAGPSGEALALLRELVDSHFFGDGMEWSWCEGVTLMEKDRSLFDRIRAALASPGAMEGAQAAQPVAWQGRKRFRVGTDQGKPQYAWCEWEPTELAIPDDWKKMAKGDPENYQVRPLYAHPPTGEPT